MPSFFFHVVVDLDVPFVAPSSSAPQLSHREEGVSPSPGSFRDWRYDLIRQQLLTMASVYPGQKSGLDVEGGSRPTSSMGADSSGLTTKARYEPCDSKEEEVGWGVIRLSRDAEETPGLYEEPPVSKNSKGNKHAVKRDSREIAAFKDEDCTTLCVLAVPSYLTPSDFLGFVGEKTRDEVSHFRMIRSERSNRYMVLMKFRNGKKARVWRREWNGRAFDDFGSENCQVVFIKSISIRVPSTESIPASSFPDMINDPFTPLVTTTTDSKTVSASSQFPPAISTSAASSRVLNKPAPPPTPSLIELPTCPVCLERMDESTGLLTILCQHVFHCTCLQKWKGSGCPVCRYTHSSFPNYGKRSHLANGDHSTNNDDCEAGLNECTVCRSDENIWICLICGNVGCGRYDGAHAFHHYEQSGHCFSMELASQRVWDYASDSYVHRIVQDKTDGKFVELTHPEAASYGNRSQPRTEDDPRRTPERGADDEDTTGEGDGDYVPRTKLHSIGLEYTALLTSQLDSQRAYFEEIISRFGEKTARATSAAESASTSASSATAALASLRAEHETLLSDTVGPLEKERDRALKRADRFEGMARRLEKEWRDEKAMNEALVGRVKGLEGSVAGLQEKVKDLEEEKRDLAFFISGGEKLRQLTSPGPGSDPLLSGGVDSANGENANERQSGRQGDRQVKNITLDRADVEGGTVIVPDRPAPFDKTSRNGGRGKGKGKGRR